MQKTRGDRYYDFNYFRVIINELIEEQGKGYATSAVKLVLDETVNKLKLHRIEAGTSPDNIGLQIVLIKKGFQFVGRNSKYIYQNGKWQDSLNFEKILFFDDKTTIL